MEIYRQTYGLLDWLAEVGGLFNALRIFGSFLVIPFSNLAVDSAMMSKLFKSRKNRKRSTNRDSTSGQALETEELESLINHEFYKRKKIEPKGCL